MKKMLLAAMAVFVVCGAFAQRNYHGQASFQWGAKAGRNISKLTNLGVDMKPSIYAGVFAEFGVTHWMGIQPELVYSRQGFKTEFEGISHKFRYNYLNLPILAKFYIWDKLSFDTGPQFGILLNATDKYKQDGEKTKADIEDAKNFDVSWALGVSYRFGGNYDISFRYNLGLMKVHDIEGDKPKNSVIQIGMGYRF